MTKFPEDMLFKNVSEEDAYILLDLLGIKSEKVKVWIKKLRQFHPTNSSI